MNIENLQGRATLTVKRQAAQQTFLHCQIKISISKDDTGILGLKAEHRAQPMRFRMLVLEQISHPAAADPVTLRAIQKAIALIELRFTPQGESH